MAYRIRQIREQQGISQIELCEKTGLTKATIWRLETEPGAVTTSTTLVKIAEALNVTIDDLFLANEVQSAKPKVSELHDA